MDRTLFTEEHEAFRKAFRSFADREIVPNQARWRDQGQVDRDVWRKAGAQGFLCPWLEEKYGGPGADFLCSVVIMEELADIHRRGNTIIMVTHNPALTSYATRVIHMIDGRIDSDTKHRKTKKATATKRPLGKTAKTKKKGKK